MTDYIALLILKLSLVFKWKIALNWDMPLKQVDM